ncbi:MAG: hypothetical protein ACYC21_05650 [Eubacteriales bacterium]
MLTSINPDLLSILSALLAIIISQNRNTNQLNVIGNFLISVGSLVVTEVVQIQAQQAEQDNKEQIKNIRQQIEQLQNQLERLTERM